MRFSRCPLHCEGNHTCNRRDFLRGSAGLLTGSVLLSGCSSMLTEPMFTKNPIRACGPASKYVPTIKATFVRRKEDYGMWWPGEVFDGQAVLQRYTRELNKN